MQAAAQDSNPGYYRERRLNGYDSHRATNRRRNCVQMACRTQGFRIVYRSHQGNDKWRFGGFRGPFRAALGVWLYFQ
jgi:hypothetical protein